MLACAGHLQGDNQCQQGKVVLLDLDEAADVAQVDDHNGGAHDHEVELEPVVELAVVPACILFASWTEQLHALAGRIHAYL